MFYITVIIINTIVNAALFVLLIISMKRKGKIV